MNVNLFTLLLHYFTDVFPLQNDHLNYLQITHSANLGNRGGNDTKTRISENVEGRLQ